MSLLSFPKRHPLVFGSVLALVKTAGVDYAVQRLGEKKEHADVDWKRVAVFGTFGFWFLGCWQYGLFVKIMPRLCPGTERFINLPWREKLKDSAGLRGVLIQNAIENGINNPLLYFPIFYTVQEWLNGGELRNGIQKYKKNWRKDVVDIWKVWVPAQLFNFAFSPLWFRVPYVATVSVLWTSIVSFTRGSFSG